MDASRAADVQIHEKRAEAAEVVLDSGKTEKSEIVTTTPEVDHPSCEVVHCDVAEIQPAEALAAAEGKASSELPHLRRQTSDSMWAEDWNIDGSHGHYHDKRSLFLVVYAQIIYIVSLVIIIPTAGDYAASLGNASNMYFGLIIGISSIIDPVVSALWTSVLKVSSLRNVLLTNASISLVCSLMYVGAQHCGQLAVPVLLASRCLLGFGSVQMANLQYLGCAISRKRVTFAHFLTTAAIAYGFAFGTLLAFLLSLLASYTEWDQNTLPGWFTALLWLTYIPLHRLLFTEPDRHAGILDPESKIRLNKEMRPKMRREPFGGLLPCRVAIFVVAVVKGAFEVMTMEITKDLWKWEVMSSALFLGAIMLIVALTTLLAYVLQKRLGMARMFLCGLVGATLLLPFYYIPVSNRLQREMGSALGMAVYLLVSILALSSLNLGRTMAFSLTTALPTPQWRGYFLSVGSQIFTMGRGAGPILVGVLDDRRTTVSVLEVGCLVATIVVAWAFYAKRLECKEHEVGPGTAEEQDESGENFMSSIDQWFEWLGKVEGGHASSDQKPGPATSKEVVPGPRLLGQGNVRKIDERANVDGI
eukprot:TRINITY_DN21628_c0_g1_i1.p1 TRINITY_DN21628_c0_g1~~TRINITY_DN21628_c0_g1_i1.p1  ORF type:complete len:588 (-),score=85.15 TRINITY_DN21628_c0_g1_i1:104-1867(-)